MRGKFAAKPGQIESCIDPTNQVIVRHRIFEVKLVEKRIHPVYLPWTDMPVDDAIGGDRIGTSRPGGYDYRRGHPKAGTFICELEEIALKVRTH